MALNYYLALKKAIWKGLRPILKPLFKSLIKLIKNQADFFKDFVLNRPMIETEYYLAIAPLCPEIFSKKVPKLINKVSEPAVKKSLSKILKTVTASGFSKKIDFYTTIYLFFNCFSLFVLLSILVLECVYLKFKKKKGYESQKIDREFNRNCIHLLASNLPRNLTQKEVHKSQFSGVTITEVIQSYNII